MKIELKVKNIEYAGDPAYLKITDYKTDIFFRNWILRKWDNLKGEKIYFADCPFITKVKPMYSIITEDTYKDFIKALDNYKRKSKIEGTKEYNHYKYVQFQNELQDYYNKNKKRIILLDRLQIKRVLLPILTDLKKYNIKYNIKFLSSFNSHKIDIKINKKFNNVKNNNFLKNTLERIIYNLKKYKLKNKYVKDIIEIHKNYNEETFNYLLHYLYNIEKPIVELKFKDIII